ncbi:Caspase-2 [Ooceraea biroi]|uniref:Caspase-2 n=1 Tax=Ooceraea biroi TaxID=2015173 RepID=A0A026W1V2_OOCBI|nr:Caspase-2 [Ooceraea biroi]
MHRRDRKRIDYYCESVVPKIDITTLFPKLLENKVYNRDDVNISTWTSIHFSSQVTIRFKKIHFCDGKAKRGKPLDVAPAAHRSIRAGLICPTSLSYQLQLNEQYGGSSNERQEESMDNIVWANKPLKIEVSKATRFLDSESCTILQRYPMRSKPRGLVLVISNIYFDSTEKPRLAAEHDEANLKELFKQMGFEVVTHQNLTGQQIKEAVRTFSKRKDLEKVDSCFVFITSHGTEDKMNNSEIQGTDYQKDAPANYEKVLCSDIYDYFTVEACPQLAEKPKIFVFQICRGEKVQKSVAQSRVSIDSLANKADEYVRGLTTRNYSDMLIVQATLPGHVAYRDEITGSWFIQILCKVFMTYACTEHIQDLFSMIDAHLKYLRMSDNKCQTSTVESRGFNKHCYLHPGLYEEDLID